MFQRFVSSNLLLNLAKHGSRSASPAFGRSAESDARAYDSGRHAQQSAYDSGRHVQEAGYDSGGHVQESAYDRGRHAQQSAYGSGGNFDESAHDSGKHRQDGAYNSGRHVQQQSVYDSGRQADVGAYDVGRHVQNSSRFDAHAAGLEARVNSLDFDRIVSERMRKWRALSRDSSPARHDANNDKTAYRASFSDLLHGQVRASLRDDDHEHDFGQKSSFPLDFLLTVCKKLKAFMYHGHLVPTHKFCNGLIVDESTHLQS
jgi:hypothetical protein